MGSFELEIGNDFSEISRLSGWLTDLLESCNAGVEVTHAVQLCAAEAATNVVSYAFPPGEADRIQIKLDISDSGIVLTLRDHGVAFDPLSVGEVTPPTDLASAAIGGLGIKLMREFSSAIHYAREGNANRLEMRFAR